MSPSAGRGCSVAILSVDPVPRSETSQQSLGQDGAVTKTADLIYQVIVDADHSPTEIEVATDGNTTVPEVGSEHPNDPHRRLKVKTPTRSDEDPYTWFVRLSYSNQVQEGSLNPHPLLQRPRIVAMGSRQLRRQIFLDRAGSPIVNTADQPYTTPVEVDHWDRFVRIVANFATMSEQFRAAWDGALNSNSFHGDAPGTVLVSMPTVVEATENNITFAKATLELFFRAEGWQPRLLSQGLRQKVWKDNDPEAPDATFTIEAIPDPNSATVTEEMYLDQYGRSVGTDPALAAEQIVLWYRDKNIAPLNLPPLVIPTPR